MLLFFFLARLLGCLCCSAVFLQLNSACLTGTVEFYSALLISLYVFLYV